MCREDKGHGVSGNRRVTQECRPATCATDASVKLLVLNRSDVDAKSLPEGSADGNSGGRLRTDWLYPLFQNRGRPGRPSIGFLIDLRSLFRES